VTVQLASSLLARCFWCNRRNKKASDWEQEALGGRGWHRLCQACAGKRLRNPYSALLGMRKANDDPEATEDRVVSSRGHEAG
jgi:hypothetical protein